MSWLLTLSFILLTIILPYYIGKTIKSKTNDDDDISNWELGMLFLICIAIFLFFALIVIVGFHLLSLKILS